MANGMSEFNSFLATHKLQLETAGVPELYWCSLFAKLSSHGFSICPDPAFKAVTVLSKECNTVDLNRSIILTG